jgi:DNA modification methylase
VTAVILRGDAGCLPLPDASVDLICTSPPYWGLRSYSDGGEHYDGQIGSEETPGEFIAALLACTREWVRVLKPEGSIFVNLGDKYAQRPGQFGPQGATGARATRRQAQGYAAIAASREVDYGGTAPKSLLGLPWRYALACTDQLGLILRAEIIWNKPNGLPESVQDRVRRSHEQVFHFTRQPRYFAAVDEVREAHSTATHARGKNGVMAREGQSLPTWGTGGTQSLRGVDKRYTEPSPLGKPPGSVWEIPSQPLTVPAHLGVDHFAAFPMELPRRIILGWSPSGICTECGEGRRPVAEADTAKLKTWALGQIGGRGWHGDGTDPKRALGIAAADRNRVITGYACACPQPGASTRPAVVVDPFGGTGTTALVADMLGRTGVTIDRSADYCRIAQWRTADPAERARALGVPRPPPVPDGQGSLFEAGGAS